MAQQPSDFAGLVRPCGAAGNTTSQLARSRWPVSVWPTHKSLLSIAARAAFGLFWEPPRAPLRGCNLTWAEMQSTTRPLRSALALSCWSARTLRLCLRFRAVVGRSILAGCRHRSTTETTDSPQLSVAVMPRYEREVCCACP